MKKAIIVGCDGQDGRLLFDFLSRLRYKLLGVARTRLRSNVPGWTDPLDIRVAEQVFELIRRFEPDEIYYLPAFHHSSEDSPPDTLELFRKSYDIHAVSLLHFLEGIRRYWNPARLFYAASSHAFGTPETPTQDETTPINPTNIYGITKAAGLMACRYYRARHSLFASVGILFNHESPLRDSGFLSKKLVRGALNIKNGKQEKIVVGDLSAEADWGYAPDYVEAMHRILNHARADDFVIATGEKHSVRDFLQVIFDELHLPWGDRVEQNPDILTKQRTVLVGNPAKLTRCTGWRPRVSFREMIRALLEAEKSLL